MLGDKSKETLLLLSKATLAVDRGKQLPWKKRNMVEESYLNSFVVIHLVGVEAVYRVLEAEEGQSNILYR